MATCQHCSKTFTPKRSDARYCGSTCRSKARTIRLAGGQAPRASVAPPPVAAGLLTDATRDELGPLADTADGILLLTLAARIDSVPETAPALATLSKEFAARKSDLLALAPKSKANPFDELQALRERRRA